MQTGFRSKNIFQLLVVLSLVSCHSKHVMCETSIRSKRRKNHQHRHQLKFFKCRSHHLCVFSFIFYCSTCGIYCNASHISVNITNPPKDIRNINTVSTPEDLKHDPWTVTSQQSFTTVSSTVGTTNHDTGVVTSQHTGRLRENIHCDDAGCYVKISSSKQALENMMAVGQRLHQNYARKEVMTGKSLQNLLQDMKPKEKVPEPSHNHDHGNHAHETHNEHENEIMTRDNEHENEKDFVDRAMDTLSDETALDAFLDYLYYGNDTNPESDTIEIPCYDSVKDLTEAYFNTSGENLQLSLGDFITLLPQIILDISRPACEKGNHGDSMEENNFTTPATKYVWLISFGSVFLISVVSLCGVLMIPLLRYSKILNHLIAYLVALAVGTLCGDALLHLLPRAAGLHDHSSGAESEKDHFDFMWKGLVACGGIYFFFLLETIMGFVHKRKMKTSSSVKHSHCHDNQEEHDCDASSSNSDENQGADQGNSTATPCGSSLLGNEGKHSYEVINITPLINGEACTHGEHDAKPEGRGLAITIFEEPLETGHHHHHHSNEVPKTIASLAWMVIVGDGMHNITDGLAIGAAFSSSIAAGLGTVLAIFFHEIPQELADFAVLLNAGMTAKQALFWNFLSACMCFIGLVIGLLVGEYTNGIIMWILAFTAGGFLYIALVDMLPALMKQLSQTGYVARYFIQNAGLLTGFGLMVLIALKEESFESYFD